MHNNFNLKSILKFVNYLKDIGNIDYWEYVKNKWMSQKYINMYVKNIWMSHC